jgi:hypothetical protein
MAQDVLETLRDLADNVEFTDSYLRRAKRAINKAKKELSLINTKINETDVSKVAPVIIRELIISIEELAPQLYKKEVDSAVTRAVEFSDPLYHSALVNLADNPDLFTITPRGSGFSSTIRVMVNMDSVAGDLEGWANAVDTVRANLNIKEERDPAKASQYWKAHIYGTGTYDWTLAARFAVMEGLAPFWQLLDQGNTGTHLSSDIGGTPGGTPYPRYGRPTNFVHHTEESIRRAFIEARDSARAEYNRNRQSMEDLRSYVITVGDELQVAIDFVHEDILQMKLIAKKFDVPLEAIDSAKFQKAKERAVLGEKGIAELGIRGGRRIRASLSTMTSLL